MERMFVTKHGEGSFQMSSPQATPICSNEGPDKQLPSELSPTLIHGPTTTYTPDHLGRTAAPLLQRLNEKTTDPGLPLSSDLGPITVYTQIL